MECHIRVKRNFPNAFKRLSLIFFEFSRYFGTIVPYWHASSCIVNIGIVEAVYCRMNIHVAFIIVMVLDIHILHPKTFGDVPNGHHVLYQAFGLQIFKRAVFKSNCLFAWTDENIVVIVAQTYASVVYIVLCIRIYNCKTRRLDQSFFKTFSSPSSKFHFSSPQSSQKL